MNDIPRQNLKQIISQNPTVCQDAKLCEGLLRDFCGQYRQEINVLVSAIKEGVATDLLNSQSKVSVDILLPRLTTRLEDRWGMRPDVAIWAVDSVALALGVISQPRSIAIIANNDPPILAPKLSEPQQSIVTPDPNITTVSEPHSIPKTVYVWSALSTLAAIILGGAYYSQSQNFDNRVQQQGQELKRKIASRDKEITNIKKENKNLKKEIDELKRKKSLENLSVSLCNQSSFSIIDVAISYPIGNSQMRSRGWRNIEQGKCESIALQPDRGDIYIYGYTRIYISPNTDSGDLEEPLKSKTINVSTKGEYQFCVTYPGPFDITTNSSDTSCRENYELIKAKKITLDPSINNSYTFKHPKSGSPGAEMESVTILDIKPSTNE